MLEKSSFWENTERNKLLLCGLVIYGLALVFLPRQSHEWDSYCWGLWSELIQKKGLAAVYSEGSPVNYLPLYLYVLRLYAWVIPAEQIFQLTWILKSISLLFDLGSLMLIADLSSRKTGRWKYLIAGFANLAFVYNSLFWNQVDGILGFLILASFLTAHQNRLMSSLWFFLLALNFKFQGIVFLPLLGLYWLPMLNLRRLLTGMALLFSTQVLILLPYLLAGNAPHILDVLQTSVDYYPAISMNAFNLWHLLLGNESLMFVKDDAVFLAGLSYKHCGLILFFTASAMVLLPVLQKSISALRSGGPLRLTLEQGLLSMALISCFFFYLNTQMHERYIHPAIVFSTALAFLFKARLQWVLLSVAYVLSLESICRMLHLDHYDTFVFMPRFIALLYAAGILLLMKSWIRTLNLRKEN